MSAPAVPGDLVARLARAVGRIDPGAVVADVSPVRHGAGTSTYRAVIEGPGGRRDVVAKVGQGRAGAIDWLGREIVILEVLRDHPAVPAPRLVVAERAGPPESGRLLVTEHVAGASPDARPWFADTTPASVVGRRVEALAAALAAAHTVPLAAVPERFRRGVSPADEADRTRRRVVRLVGRTAASRVVEALVHQTPEAGAPVVLHGDARLGNGVFVDDRLAALLDWEAWHIGDPRVDLGFLLASAERDHTAPLAAGSVTPWVEPALASYVDGSHALGRREPSPDADLDWFVALGHLRLAATARAVAPDGPSTTARTMDAGSRARLAAAVRRDPRLVAAGPARKGPRVRDPATTGSRAGTGGPWSAATHVERARRLLDRHPDPAWSVLGG